MSTLTTYENFKAYVSLCNAPCAVLSVERKGDGICGDIKVIAANDSFSMTNENVEGKIYTDYMSKDPKFEDICYRAAFNGESYHAYLDTRKIYGFWTENTTIPLIHEKDSDIGYCQLTYFLTKEMDPGKYSIIAPDIASFVIETCLKLRGEDDFYTKMNTVTKDIREYTGSYAASIMTISRDLYQFEVVSENVLNNEVCLKDIFSNVSYDIVESWEELVTETNSIIIRNEEDMLFYESKAPDWVKTLRENSVKTLCLVPFIHQNTIIGYLYITNFDVVNLTKIKNTIELLSVFLASETAHHIFIERLRSLSLIDARTGVYNRNAMNNKVDELAAQLNLKPMPFSVAFCYLNTLKTINKNEGHETGNKLLKEAAKLLKDTFKNDYIYRSSGDEFAIISTNSTETEFKNKVEKLKENASNPEWIYFTVGYYTDNTDGALHSAMRYANKYEREFNEEFYYNYPDMVK